MRADHVKTCVDCGRRFNGTTTKRRCYKCDDHAFLWRQYAAGKVHYAVTTGKLPNAATLDCAFCGEPAIGYDHDDYGLPLNVKPICRSCNWQRAAYVPREPAPYRERA